MKTALVIGGNSTIGLALQAQLLRRGVDVQSTTRSKLNLATPPESWPELPTCDATFLCAAVTKLEACEKDPEGTRLINVERTVELARKLNAQGSFVVFISTNHVFDGSKPFRRADDATSPLNQYGAQKAEAEKAILALGNSAVVRLTKVVTTPFSLFSQWRERLLASESVRAFTDMAVAPVPLTQAVDSLISVGNVRKEGLWQLSGPRDANYYELAVALARKLGVSESLVEATTAREAGIPAHFSPKYSTYEQKLPKPVSVPDPLELL